MTWLPSSIVDERNCGWTNLLQDEKKHHGSISNCVVINVRLDPFENFLVYFLSKKGWKKISVSRILDDLENDLIASMNIDLFAKLLLFVIIDFRLVMKQICGAATVNWSNSIE